MFKFMGNVAKFTFYTTLLTLILACPIYIALDKFYHIKKDIHYNLSTSVEVHTECSSGSGFVFINDGRAFIWTCAHVISDAVTDEVEIDILNKVAKSTSWSKDVYIKVKLFSPKLLEVGEVKLFAKVLRYSREDDLAVLELYDHTLFPTSVKFPLDFCYKPSVGDKMFHVGSMNGWYGHKSIVEGIHGIHGIKLNDNKYYDRIGLCIQPGSSGGGVFEHNTGICIGIAARSLDNNAFNQCFIIPWHRMVSFSNRMDCLWALSLTETPPESISFLSDEKFYISQEDFKKFLVK